MRITQVEVEHFTLAADTNELLVLRAVIDGAGFEYPNPVFERLATDGTAGPNITIDSQARKSPQTAGLFGLGNAGSHRTAWWT